MFRHLFRRLFYSWRREMREKFHRHVSLPDLIADRWETARFLGFGENSTCYNNVLVIGEVKVGKGTWIGPNVILDGTGGLEIGDYCSISAGVQIYTHHTVKWALTGGKTPPETAPVVIGSRVYIGPQTVVQMGSTIGDEAVVGAMSLVRSDIPAGMRAWGAPARVIGPSRSEEAPQHEGSFTHG